MLVIASDLADTTPVSVGCSSRGGQSYGEHFPHEQPHSWPGALSLTSAWWSVLGAMLARALDARFEPVQGVVRLVRISRQSSLVSAPFVRCPQMSIVKEPRLPDASGLLGLHSFVWIPGMLPVAALD